MKNATEQIETGGVIPLILMDFIDQKYKNKYNNTLIYR